MTLTNSRFMSLSMAEYLANTLLPRSVRSTRLQDSDLSPSYKDCPTKARLAMWLVMMVSIPTFSSISREILINQRFLLFIELYGAVVAPSNSDS